MRSQRGSITIIALTMLLFLVILGGSWIIMMTQGKTNALADEKQQQAWYAAEAGLKRAEILIKKGNDKWDSFTTEYKNLKTNDETKFQKIDLETLKTSTDLKTRPWYAVSIATKNGSIDLTGAATKDLTYTVTSVGEYMGERKVIKRDFTLSSSGGIDNPPDNPPGKDEPTTPGDPTIAVPDAFVAAGGSINVTGSWNTFNRTDSKGIFISRDINDTGTGNNGNGTNAALNKYWNNSKGVSDFAIYAYMPESMFAVPSTATKIVIQDGGNIGASDKIIADNTNPSYTYTKLGANKALYVQDMTYTTGTNTTYKTWSTSVTLNAEDANGTTIYFDKTSTALFQNKKFNGIKGPTSGEPVTLIFNGDLSLSGLAITGNVRIMVNGKLKIENGSGDDNDYTNININKLMLLSNGDMTINQSFGKGNASITYVFLSSNTNINIDGSSLIGRLQAGGDINFSRTGITYTYSNAVLDTYSLPKGLQKTTTN
jgi:Tfp pilus assembly protein PilX